MHRLSNEEIDKWIADYAERERASSRRRVADAEAAVPLEQAETLKAENARFTNREHKKTFQELVVAIRDSLRDLANSKDGEDGDDDAVATAPTTFGELMECFDIVPGISQLQQGTSPPGSSLMRPGCGKPQSNTASPCPVPAMEPDPPLIRNAKPVGLVRLYPCI